MSKIMIMDNKDFRKDKLISLMKARLGKLIEYLNDPKTIEIMLNPDGTVWGEKWGEKIEIIGKMDDYTAQSFLAVISTSLGKELNQTTPILEGELLIDGSRFSAQIPPIVKNPVFTIRKKPSLIITLSKYVEDNIISSEQYNKIKQAVIEHKNILIAGGTASGKTTLTNAIIAEIIKYFPDERVLIMEDTGEIQCAAKNSVIYHTTNNITLTDLIKVTLRMRPDRLIVGEIRDHAALDLLDAWNTGHEGGICTIHSNSAELALLRLQSLVSRNSYAPKNISELIGEAVHVIVFIEKLPVGRRVTDIVNVEGYDVQKEMYIITR